MILLSPHFTLEEFIRSDLAIRHGIDNSPTPDVLENLKLLAETLETVRAILGRPLHISSGYRCPQLNAVAKGSKTSAHMYGRAADFECPAFGPPADVFSALKLHADDLAYDQLINEAGAWVHIGISASGEVPRAENLIATFTPDGVRYARA